MKEAYKTIITITSVAILICISIFLRIPKEKTEKYDNIDATYHTLLTMECYEETPISIHKFLPIVSLGENEDKNIPWGSCISDKYGNYYYTSFSPAGFVAPYLFVKLFYLPINIYSLYAFNCVLLVATITVMSIIFCKLFKKYINKNLIIFLTALIYLFQIEVMHSQGVIYWVQSLFQFLLGIHFLLFLNYENKKCKIAFYVMCLLMPYIEWTGFISNFAFGVILFIKDIIENKKIRVKAFINPIIIGILTVISFGIFSAHFLLNVVFEQYVSVIKARFFARNLTTSAVGLKELFEGYCVRSFKYILYFLLGMTILVLIRKKYRNKLWELIKEYKYPIMFFLIIMLENIVMMQHAVEYTFDRLKLMYLIITYFFIIFIAFYKVSENRKKIKLVLIIILLSVISTINIVQYKNGYEQYIIKESNDINNKIYANYIIEKYNRENSIICSSKPVRGYMNLLFKRGIYEHKTYEEAKMLISDKRYLIYINAIDYANIENIAIFDVEKNEKFEINIEENKAILKNAQ